MRRWAVVLIIAGFIACGDDGPTEPGNAQIGGVWAYSASNLSGSGLSCNISDVELTINQTGSTFTGSTGGGTLSCTGGGESISEPLGQGVIVNGTINEDSVSFDIDTSDFHHVGTATGNSMTGTVTLEVDLGAPLGVLILQGNWSAARQ